MKPLFILIDAEGNHCVCFQEPGDDGCPYIGGELDIVQSFPTNGEAEAFIVQQKIKALSDHQLILLLLSGAATPQEKQEYVHRVTTGPETKVCQRGHYDCALVPNGPCSTFI